jgi:wyosine [tRNA(Phe)-imidazoG37] synthetase (radical SAM superfamily)
MCHHQFFIAIDATGSPGTYAGRSSFANRFNRFSGYLCQNPPPTTDLHLPSILDGLRIFASGFGGAIEVEVFVCPGLNDSKEEISGLRSYLMTIDRLESVYLNSAVRSPLETEVKTADQGRLNDFRTRLNLAIPVTTAFEHNLLPPKVSSWNRPAASSDILKLLLRHPCSEEQLEHVLGSEPEKIYSLLDELSTQGKIKRSANGFWALND